MSFDSERMQYLANAQASLPPGHAALMQEGYGEDSQSPGGSDDPGAAAKVLGKAVSLAMCYYATTYGKKTQQSHVLEKLWPVLNSIWLAVADETQPHVPKEFVYTYIKTEGKWEAMMRMDGLNPSSSFGQRVAYVMDEMYGGGSDEIKEQYAVAIVSTFAARWAAGVNQNLFPNITNYVLISNYFNNYYTSYEPAKIENFPRVALTKAGGESTLSASYNEVFEEMTAKSARATAVDVTVFGFEDLSSIFTHPIDNQLEKDSELQAYHLHGELVYDPWWWYATPNCEDTQVPLKNPQGKVTGYLNIGPTSFPCVDESRDVTPVTGTSFERTFIEAPPVSGVYDSHNVSYINDVIRSHYPSNTYFNDTTNSLYEDFIDVDCHWVTTYGCGPHCVNHPITDVSRYEPYYFVDNHEANAGNPFPGPQCSLGGGGWCSLEGYYPSMELCVAAGGEWAQQCIHPAPPSPSPYPGLGGGAGAASLFEGNYGYVRDMSLRHSMRREDADETIPYWEDQGSWEWTGFVMAPLQFTPGRIDGLYRDTSSVPFYTNPVLDASALGRRAFTYHPDPTSQVVTGTCGPPQQYINPNSIHHYNYWGGPFVYGQVWAENKTKRQQAKVNLFAGWPYRYSENPYGVYDLHRTGGFNFPLIKEAFAYGWSDPMDIAPKIDFQGSKISNNWNVDGNRQIKYNGEVESFYIGTGVHPPGSEHAGQRFTGVWEGLPLGSTDPGWIPYGAPTAYETYQPDPFHYNQELATPQMFFGMGDGCVGIPTKTEWSLNAGQRYSYHVIDLTGVTHPYLKTITGEIAEFVNKYTNGVEEFYKPGILGQYGEKYWNVFTTGWINTGDYAGEAVHCLHKRTGISTTPGSYLRPEYYWLGTGIFDVHFNFPYQGVDCLLGHGPLSPYPNISRCCEFFDAPFYGDTGCLPTTTTTVDPNATTTTTNSYNSSTTTTTTELEDPSMPNCGGTGIKVECPGGEPFTMGYYEYSEGMCTYDQCISLSCPSGEFDNIAWDSGIYPYQRDWVEQKLKQRGENPPRYWYGPYASTYFTFLYPNAQNVLDIHYPTGDRETYPVTGFPEKIVFDVTVEEYLVKDFVSGGYINTDGEITWDEILKSEDGGPAPTFATGNTGAPWDNLVDERYIPLIEQSTETPLPGEESPPFTKIGGKSEQHDIVANYTLANGRNFETYDHPFFFERGNLYSTGITYGYGTTVDNASFGQMLFPVGGFHRYSKYSYEQETTYARPTFTLDTLENNPSSLINALKPGNKLFYECGGNGLGQTPWKLDHEYYDPIYFMPMESNLRETGIYNQGGLADDNQPFTGTLVHPKKIYGDRWMGIRPASLFSLFSYEMESGYNGHNITSWVAGDPGNLITIMTGKDGSRNVPFNSEYDPTCITNLMSEYYGWAGGGMGGDDDDPLFFCENLVDCYGTCSGIEGPPALNETRVTEYPCMEYEMSDSDHALERVAGDYRVWLFNLDASGVDMHVRAPDYLSGYWANPGLGMGAEGSDFGPNYSTLSTPERYLDPEGASTASAATATLGFRVTGTNMRWDITTSNAVPSAGNKQIDFFKPEWVDNNKEINYQGIIFEEYGVLFEKPPSEEWQMGEDNDGNVTGYENIYQLGARKAEEGYHERIRVSGWKETSKVVIKLSDFQIRDYGPFPNDSYFTMEESGNCQVDGTLEYNNQAEASIYSEGIVMEDKSQDPLRDILDYPHYASDTIKRGDIRLPYGEYPTGEWNPDFDNYPMKHVFPAPSRMMTRKIPWIIPGTGMDWRVELFKGTPYFYNRYVWPTRSDMSQWNGGSLSYEGSPDIDAQTYPVSELMISAAAGQPTPDKPGGSQYIERNYVLTQHIAFYDSVVLDPTINKEWQVDFAIKDAGQGGLKFSVQPHHAYVVPVGTTVRDIQKGIVAARKQTLKPDYFTPTHTEEGEEGVVGIIT